MFALSTGDWIAVALLAPFWWGLGLLVLALLGDIAASWRGPVGRLFDRLEGAHSVTSDRRTLPHAA